MGKGIVNYADTHRMIQQALEGDYGLWVQLDSGDFDLFGADLESTWDMLSPGEAFTVLGVVLPQSKDVA